MNFKLFDRYGGYRVLMFKFNHFNPAGLFSPISNDPQPKQQQQQQSSFSSHAGIIRWSISELFGGFIFLNPVE